MHYDIYTRAVDIVDVQEKSLQTDELRSLCKKSQKLEKEISRCEHELDEIAKKEKTSTPVIKNIYEILTRCFTVLFNIQRFFTLLIIAQVENKNDFVRCSIIIKNFASYFKNVSSQLDKSTSEITKLKTEKMNYNHKLEEMKSKYNKLIETILYKTNEITKNNEETIIQNIVYHIATKSSSIEELDAELESENAIGVLKNTKISTSLSLSFPVNGRIVSEFGDKGPSGKMIYYTSFECRPLAIVTSPAKGLVVFSGKFLNYGNMVIISNGDYRVFLYGIDSIFVSAGDVVEIGDYVGRMSNNLKSGKSIILKMELRRSGEALDPRHWLLQNLEEKALK